MVQGCRRRCIRLQHLETFEFRSLLTHELVGAGPRGAVIETMLARLDGIPVEPALSRRCALHQLQSLPGAILTRCSKQAHVIGTMLEGIPMEPALSKRYVARQKVLSRLHCSFRVACKMNSYPRADSDGLESSDLFTQSRCRTDVQRSNG